MPYCTHCGSNNPESATFCAACGRPLASQPHAQSETESSGNRWLLPLLAGGVVLIAVAAGIAWASTQSDGTAVAEDSTVSTERSVPEDTTPNSTASTTTTIINDLDGRTVRVAVENNYPPYNFIKDGEGQGWDYDAWNEICKRLNCRAEFIKAGYPDIILETAQGQYDTAADGLSITDERKEVVAFSDPYMVIEQKLMVRIDESRFGNKEQFVAGDYRLGTQVGTTNYNTGVEMLGGDARIDAYEQFGAAVQALINGVVDAVIIDDTAGQGYKGASEGAVRLLPEPLQSDLLGFLYPKGSDLIEPVNKVLQEMAEDGTLDDLAKKWFVDFEA